MLVPDAQVPLRFDDVHGCERAAAVLNPLPIWSVKFVEYVGEPAQL